MKIIASRQFRYRVIDFVVGNQSHVKTTLLRLGIIIVLSIMLVPVKVSREIVYGVDGEKLDLKSSLRMMLWLWNRSWIPFQHSLSTYYDIGWVLSEASCQNLSARGFLEREPLKRRCDRAQYALSGIRNGVESADVNKISRVDSEVCSLVSSILTDAQNWATSAHRTKVTHAKASKTEETDTEPKRTEGTFDSEATRNALLDFDDLCKNLGQEYFLVSGTFLGVVRDGAFIGHDNDIDVGVFEDGLLDDLLPALQASENFTVVKIDHICQRVVDAGVARYSFMRDPAIIKVVHRTGVAIDIFNHFYEGELIWHGTSCQRWDNKHFVLKDYEFLKRSFKGAMDFDLYFTENYGANWRIPDPDFDSAVDTPNLSFVGSANGLVFFAWTISRFVSEVQPAKVLKHIDMLCRLGACRIEDGKVRVN